jgi:uncharacterized protein YjiS (DUF1127 family)
VKLSIRLGHPDLHLKGTKKMTYKISALPELADPRQSVFPQLVRKYLALLSEWESRRKLRRWLARMTDQKLRDIGLTRADVLACCNASLKQDVGEALRQFAKSRSGNW